MGVAGKLALVQMTAALTVLAVMGAAHYYAGQQAIDREQGRLLEEITARLALSLPESVYEFDARTVDDTLRAEFPNRDLTAVLVWPHHGLLPRYGFVRRDGRLQKTLESPDGATLRARTKALFVHDPRRGEEVVGRVEVFIDRSHAERRLMRAVAFRIGELTLAVSLMLMLLVFIVNRRLAAPLETIRHAMVDVQCGNHDEEGKLQTSAHLESVRAITGTFAELKLMGHSFLEMVHTLQEREEALRVSEEKFRTLVESTSDWIWEINAEGAFTYASPQVEDILGYTPNEMIGKTPFDLMPAEEAERIAHVFKEIIAEGEPIVALHNVNLHKDGRLIVLETSGVPVLDEAGKVTGYCGVDRDITERKKAEQDLRESEFFLRETQKVAQLGGWKLNPETDFLAWTEGVYDIIEVPLDYKPGFKEGIKYYVPEYRPALQERIERCHLHGEPFAIECELITESGKRLWTEVRGVARMLDGKTAYVYGTFQNISERKLVEEELRNLRNYLSNIIDSMPSVLVGVNADGKVTQWNSEAQRVTGISPQEAAGQPLAQVLPRLASEMERVREAMATRQAQSTHKQAHLEDDEVRYEDTTIFPLIANGIEGAVIRIDDVTERVRLEEMMIQSEKMLSVGGLAAGMAHEINNPLAGMMQNAEVLSNRMMGDLQANKQAAQAAGASFEAIQAYLKARDIPRMLAAIRESGVRAAKIVENMLSFARKSGSSSTPQDVCALLDSAVELAESDYDLKKKYDFRQIEIVREYASGVATVPGETTELQQVFLNILKNGAQAMREAGTRGGEMGERTPRFILRVRQGNYVVQVEIEDNGSGMDDKTCKRIFEPFFTTKSPGVGTGLGLSVSYFIITENHEGQMSVESTPGLGTKLIIRLPLERNTSK